MLPLRSELIPALGALPDFRFPDLQHRLIVYVAVLAGDQPGVEFGHKTSFIHSLFICMSARISHGCVPCLMDAGPASGRAGFDRRPYDRWMARVPETRIADLDGTMGAAVRGVRRRVLLVSGIGFFTDAYDLFVIGIVSTLLKGQWHLGAGQLALLNAVMLGAAFLGALAFGRLADVIGRTRVYWMSAAIMVLAAVGSALSPSLAVLIAFRFLLGFGVGGDYPVSAVLMSEYAHHSNRGRMVGLVFSAQAVGLVVGPLVALALLGGGAGPRRDMAAAARPGRHPGGHRRLAAPQHARAAPVTRRRPRAAGPGSAARLRACGSS